MDPGLLIIMALAMIGPVLAVIALVSIRQSKSFKTICLVHLGIFTVYVLYIIVSPGERGSTIPLPEKPIKAVAMLCLHSWIAFLHALSLRKTGKPPLDQSPGSDN